VTESGEWCVIVVAPLRGFQEPPSRWNALCSLQKKLSDAVMSKAPCLAASGVFMAPAGINNGGWNAPPYAGDVTRCALDIVAYRKGYMAKAVGAVLPRNGHPH
jgi:hypothetical protein